MPPASCKRSVRICRSRYRKLSSETSDFQKVPPDCPGTLSLPRTQGDCCCNNPDFPALNGREPQVLYRNGHTRDRVQEQFWSMAIFNFRSFVGQNRSFGSTGPLRIFFGELNCRQPPCRNRIVRREVLGFHIWVRSWVFGAPFHFVGFGGFRRAHQCGRTSFLDIPRCRPWHLRGRGRTV